VRTLALVAVLGSLAPTGVHHDAVMQCRFDWLDHQTWTNREEHRTASCVLERWSVPGGLAKFDSVIDCESGWSRFAYNPGNPEISGDEYVGLAQHDEQSWPYRVHSYEPPWWHLKPEWSNPRTQIVVTVRMVIAQGWSAWSCA
jgi:hypothetical protein